MEFSDYIHDFTYSDRLLYIKSDTIYILNESDLYTRSTDISKLPKSNGKY